MSEIIRYLGKLNGFKIFIVEDGFSVPLTGVSISVPIISQGTWKAIQEDMKKPSRQGRNEIYLNTDQAKTLLQWATFGKKTICEDCKGSGEYVGLTVREECRECQGIGYFEEERY